ncbi:MAG: stage II sporulation protein M [Candidatus Pacearchaeota archaeon]
MFEFLINPKKAEKRPWEMFFIGLLYSAIALGLVDLVFIKNPVFKNYASMMIILFTVMLCIPFVFYLFAYEEREDLALKKEREILKEHGRALLALIFLFLGMLIGFVALALLLPSSYTKVNFESQIHTYCSINMPYDIKTCIDYLPEGKLERPSRSISFENAMNRFFGIFMNNLYVLLFVIIFSFIFGAGAIFILAWNASVIAIAISSLAKARNFGLAFSHYMLHGLPEIAGYFVAGLAGGIISMAIIRHDYKNENFWIILQDSLDLIIIAVLILILAAFLEVFVSPLLL